MAIASAIVAAVGVGASIYQHEDSKNKMKQAKRDMENFKWKDLKSPYENAQVSTLGADYASEQGRVAMSTGVEAARRGGTRGIVGTIPRIQGFGHDITREVYADLDRQRKGIDQQLAQDLIRIRGMEENRDIGEITGLGQMYDVYQNQQQQGQANILSSLGTFASAMGNINFGGGFGGGSRGVSEGDMLSNNLSSQGVDLSNSSVTPPADALRQPTGLGTGSHVAYNPNNPYAPRLNWNPYRPSYLNGFTNTYLG